MADETGPVSRQIEQYFDVPAASPSRLREFAFEAPLDDAAALDRERDVELDVKIELGRAEMVWDDALNLRAGEIVLLDKLAADLVDVIINERLVARGEVVVLDDRFCVRVVELIAADAA